MDIANDVAQAPGQILAAFNPLQFDEQSSSLYICTLSPYLLKCMLMYLFLMLEERNKYCSTCVHFTGFVLRRNAFCFIHLQEFPSPYFHIPLSLFLWSMMMLLNVWTQPYAWAHLLSSLSSHTFPTSGTLGIMCGHAVCTPGRRLFNPCEWFTKINVGCTMLKTLTVPLQ